MSSANATVGQPFNGDARLAAAEEGTIKLSADDTWDIDDSDPLNGLKDAEVERAREKFGVNDIPVASTPLYMLFLRQFIGFLPLLIELAALVSLVVGDYADFGII